MRKTSIGKYIVATCFFFVGQNVSAQTENVQKTSAVDLAYGAYQRGDYKTALTQAMERFTKNNNDTAAMTLLGEIFAQGLGVLPDAKKAREWYQLAAKKGDANAMTALGLMASSGKGMEKDFALAKAWFEKAAAKNEPNACHNLSLILLTSNLASDEKRAVDLLKVAAQSGILEAQHDLGVAYLKGRGVESSEENAAKWFQKAAARGYTASEVEYGILLFNGQGVKKDETTAARYFLRAAYKGNAIAQNRISWLYAVGRGVSKDLSEAAAWHQVASMKGLTDPQLNKQLSIISNDELERADRLAQERIVYQ